MHKIDVTRDNGKPIPASAAAVGNLITDTGWHYVNHLYLWTWQCCGVRPSLMGLKRIASYVTSHAWGD